MDKKANEFFWPKILMFCTKIQKFTYLSTTTEEPWTKFPTFPCRESKFQIQCVNWPLPSWVSKIFDTRETIHVEFALGGSTAFEYHWGGGFRLRQRCRQKYFDVLTLCRTFLQPQCNWICGPGTYGTYHLRPLMEVCTQFGEEMSDMRLSWKGTNEQNPWENKLQSAVWSAGRRDWRCALKSYFPLQRSLKRSIWTR